MVSTDQDNEVANDLASRAERFLSVTPRPFLRWAGSKKALLSHLLPVIPTEYRTYREPFLGSGALFFLLRPKAAVLSDACSELISTYAAVKESVERVASHLRTFKMTKTQFYAIRSRRSTGRFKGAAEFIFLNKACWNGLYRVNASGQFNVPYGRPKTKTIVDFDNLRECAHALGRPRVKLLASDFATALRGTRAGDFVYLDPPYVTTHNNNGFVDYNEKLFSWADQERLANAAAELADMGATVVVTNANKVDVLDLYPGFKFKVIERASTLASNAAFRGRVSELVLYRTPSRTFLSQGVGSTKATK